MGSNPLEEPKYHRVSETSGGDIQPFATTHLEIQCSELKPKLLALSSMVRDNTQRNLLIGKDMNSNTRSRIAVVRVRCHA
ncbi:hypothetical protein, partial [Dokdonella sp.]|uniref:hypothetical protein n=1 Tax=Dokdonella sp. TaxID=2291710 RepID=UPI0027B89841